MIDAALPGMIDETLRAHLKLSGIGGCASAHKAPFDNKYPVILGREP